MDIPVIWWVVVGLSVALALSLAGTAQLYKRLFITPCRRKPRAAALPRERVGIHEIRGEKFGPPLIAIISAAN